MPLSAGTRLGPYEILAAIGAGGMGEVYRARDTRLKREVAVKVLPREFATDPARRQRFEFEARTVAALNHPNIIAIYDVGMDDTTPYIVSELIDGEPLRAGGFALRRILHCAVQIADGLAAAHNAGVVHRDLKPDNILLTRDGHIKILDFGLARMTASRTAAAATETLTIHTEPGVVMGTVGYMSPEQVRGKEADHRSDIFSFGVVLYELLSGGRAFQGETSVETMTAILKHELPELVSVLESPKMRLFRVPLDGAPETEIVADPSHSVAFQLLSPGSWNPDGRLLVTLHDSWFTGPAVLDTHSGRIQPLPFDNSSDYGSLGWLPDGRIMALRVSLRSTLWRFTQGRE
jgi:serine/threonine protein kinase